LLRIYYPNDIVFSLYNEMNIDVTQ